MPRVYVWKAIYKPSLEGIDTFEDEVWTTKKDPFEAYATIFLEYPNAVIENLEFETVEHISSELYEKMFGEPAPYKGKKRKR